MKRLLYFFVLTVACSAQGPTPVQPQPPPNGSKPLSPADLAIAAMEQLVDEANKDRVARLSTSARVRDPFGIGMVEDIETPQIAKPVAGSKPRPPTLNDAVRTIKINGVDVSRGEAFVGTRTIRKDDTLTIRHKGTTFVARIVEISGRVVVWEDTSNGNRSITRLSLIAELTPTEPPVVASDSQEIVTQ